ncbi:alpha/beta fold hydrolase [Lactobacillus curvatus]|uniref:alpha/beta fold hydrolase n=1 Tax=Latilactobacillus fragifolii TaxID=2814244 RepID=UPI0012AF4668|nr:alpha/beta hydrolase [Latilactobacillus fragifolii]MSD83146.1 alpha/beta fold hydrolase [Latilactobacillus curvatus]MSE23244.1 alpha/beta fold hydrolase [Latilactobacillus curvatus]
MTYLTASNKTVRGRDGSQFNYRETGAGDGLPLVLLNHLSATLDNWDPRFIDALSHHRKVIVFDNRGIGLSNGEVPTTIEEMAADVMQFLELLGLKQIDLLGLSMGGFIAQTFTLKYPSVVRKLILVGTGPQGAVDIAKVGRIVNIDLLRATITRRDVKEYLFFTKTKQGQAAGKAFMARLKQRTMVKDQPIRLTAYRRQLKAIKHYAHSKPAMLSQINQPTLIVNGDHDRMVPVLGSYQIHEQIKNSQLKIYPDAGHMSLFQYTDDFVTILEHFLNR